MTAATNGQTLGTRLAALAEWSATVELADPGVATRTAAGHLLADTAGAILRGSAAAEPAALFEALRRRGGGPAMVLRRGLPTLHPADAAVANGAAGTWFELDPGHERHRTHAPVHVLPAVLAAAATGPVSDADVLVAFAVGVEIGYRTGGAVVPPDTVHPHGVWATLGAAAAVCRLLRLDPATTLAAVRVAAHLQLATTSAAPVAGATVRNALPGVAAANALLAADLAAAGVSGLPDGAATVLETVLRARPAADPPGAPPATGAGWELERSYIKVHACCHHLAAAVDAALALREALGDEPTRPARVRVGTYPRAAGFDRPGARTQLAAAFSLPYVVSAALQFGHVGPDAFTPAALTDPGRRAIEATVEVVADKTAAGRYPRHRTAVVDAVLVDGSTRRGECLAPRGTPAAPLSPIELKEKFCTLAADVLGDSAATVWARLAAAQPAPEPRTDLRAAGIHTGGQEQ